jgi:hypothetical protein
MDPDTDTLLALVSSLLTSPPPAQSVLLDVLVQSNGDVQKAAQLINSQSTQLDGKTNERKRKRVPGQLDDWLKPSSDSTPKRKSIRKERVSDSNANENIASSSATQMVPTLDLMSILRQPAKCPTVPRLAPLTLSNPSMVAAQTPCTLHLSILPSDLACRLFYTMLDASREWKRNKWWLFDKVVESPHRTSFYARKEDPVKPDDGFQEAAQYW